MLRAGVPMIQAVDILRADERSPDYQRRLDLFRAELHRGSPIPSALKHILPVQFRKTVQHIGYIPDLPHFLDRLSQWVMRRLMVLESAIKQAVYPLVLVGALLGLLVFFCGVLVPQYIGFFKESGVPLPWLLREVDRVMTQPTWVGWAVLIAIVSAGVAGIRLAARRIVGMVMGEGWSVADLLWVLGTFGMSGVPMITAVQSLSPESALVKAKWTRFKQGLLQTGTLSDNAHLYLGISRYQRELLLLGERSCQLAASLCQISEDMSAAETAQFQRKIALIQPLLLCLTAGLILVAVYITLLPVTSLIKSL